MLTNKYSKLHRFHSVIQALGLINGILFLINRRIKWKGNFKITNLNCPIFLRPNTSDANVFSQIFIDREYDINIDFEPEVIIDGGANIGLATVFFKNKYPKAKIISIEPDIENIKILLTNIVKYDNIYTKQACLWSGHQKLKLTDKFNLGKWAMVAEEVNEQNVDFGSTALNTVTIDDIINEFKLEFIDLLKLDIESAEKQLFSSNYMSWLPKTKVIVIELHDWMAEGCSKTFFLAINNAFENYSYSQLGELTVIVNRDLVK